MLFCAGIVLYNPDVLKLKKNLDAIFPQVKKIFIVDNGSENFNEFSPLLKDYQNAELHCLNENKGIAFAHNKICSLAEENKFDWALLLDQDSEVPQNIIQTYETYSDSSDIGMLCAKVVDRNFGELNYLAHKIENEFVQVCIASASAIKISAWRNVGGFCNEMFIDSVDFDMCQSLLENNYKILKINKLSFFHEVGKSKVVTFRGKQYMILNHAPVRYYYMIRNAFLLARRHHNLVRQVRLIIIRFFLVNKYETNRIEKNKMMLKGFFHGIIGKFGKYE